MLDLTLAELDVLLAKVTSGGQTPATFALAEKIRDAQTNIMAATTIRNRLL